MKKRTLIVAFALSGIGLLAILVVLEKKPAPVSRSIPLSAAPNEKPSIQPNDKSNPSTANRDYRTLLSGISSASEHPESRNDAVEAAVQSVSLNQVRGTLQSLFSSNDPGASELGLALLRRWAEREPASAASWVQQAFISSQHPGAFQQIAVAWADSDLAAAVNWATALPPGSNHDSAVLAVASEAARANPVTALDLVGGLSPSTDRNNLLVHAISQWAIADPEAALAWAGKVPQPDLRQDLLAAALIAFADKNPAAAASLAATTLDPGPVLGRVSVAMVQRWAPVDARSAAAWVAEFPESPARQAAVQALAASGVQIAFEPNDQLNSH